MVVGNAQGGLAVNNCRCTLVDVATLDPPRVACWPSPGVIVCTQEGCSFAALDVPSLHAHYRRRHADVAEDVVGRTDDGQHVFVEALVEALGGGE